MDLSKLGNGWRPRFNTAEQSWSSMTITTLDSSLDAAQLKYQQVRLSHWNQVARQLETWTGWGGYTIDA